MPRHSTCFFSRNSCRSTPYNRSAAASTLGRRSFPSAAANDRFFCERSSLDAAGSSLGGSAAFLSSVLASPVALLSRTVVSLRRSSCATFAAVAGVTSFRAHPLTAATASAVAAPSADCGSFQATLPPPSLRTPDEACHTAALLTAVAPASAPGPAAAVRRAPTSGGATRGWERLSSSCVEGFYRSPLLCCSVLRFPFSARSPLSPLQKIEDMRTATRTPIRVLTLAEGSYEEEVNSSAYHIFRLRSQARKLNRFPAASSRSNGFCTATDFSFPRRESQCASSISRRCYVCCSPIRMYLCPSFFSKIPFAHSYSIKGAGEAFQPAVLGIATFATARNAASFDIFQRLKDPPDAQQRDDAEAAATGKKRKPSDRVLHLVDEIMNLTLIEAADLCDLCQEKLVERSGGPAFSAAAAAGRTPFPHPAAMFAGMGMPGMMPTAVPAMGVAPPVASVPGSGQPSAPQASPAGAEPAKTPEKKEEAKATFSIKLMGFDAAKKVAVVKEVRAITALGLRESKDLVEQAPKIVKKGVPAAEAQALKKKLEAAGAQVALE